MPVSNVFYSLYFHVIIIIFQINSYIFLLFVVDLGFLSSRLNGLRICFPKLPPTPLTASPFPTPLPIVANKNQNVQKIGFSLEYQPKQSTITEAQLWWDPHLLSIFTLPLYIRNPIFLQIQSLKQQRRIIP